MKKYSKFFLLVIVVLAFSLRFFNNSFAPPSLNWDETSLGYNAYSILRTGKDEWGRYFPLTFEAFGDYKLPGYIYLDVPFIAAFGLNPLAVRLPSVIAGVVEVLLLYLITKRLFENELLALLAAFLLAISPWHLFLSRAALEANVALSLFLAGFYFFLISFKKPRFLIISAVFFGLTLFTYNSARVFVPLFLLSLLFLYKDSLKQLKRKLFLPVIILSVFVIVGGFLAIFKDSNSRYFWVAIVDQGAINYLDQARASTTMNPTAAKFVYNRYSYFIEKFVLNYFSHFSPNFLFLEGGSNYQFSVPGFGLLYFVELPFIVVGLIEIFRKRQKKAVLFWLLLAPIPSAITREAPHPLRAIFMLGSLQIISALGVYEVLNLIKNVNFKVSFYTIYLVLLIFSLGRYFQYYLQVYPIKYSFAWQYGYKQAVDEMVKLAPQYSHIYFTKKYGEPHIFYLFFSQYDPAKYQTNPTLVRYSRSNWRWVDDLDNITFINDWEIKSKLADKKDVLLITSPGNYPANFKTLEAINFLDSEKAFEVVESK